MVFLIITIVLASLIVYAIISRTKYISRRKKELEEMGLFEASDEECPFLCDSKRSIIDAGDDYRYCTHYGTRLDGVHWDTTYKCLACVKKIKI